MPAGGAGGIGGSGSGGGLFNARSGIVTFTAENPARPPAASTFTANQANGGDGGDGGVGGSGSGGDGGVVTGLATSSAREGMAREGMAGLEGEAEQGSGSGLFNAGTASFTGVTVNFTANQADGGVGGSGGHGGLGHGGSGGDNDGSGLGGRGGYGIGGDGGNGGDGGSAWVAASSTPRPATSPSSPGWGRRRAHRNPRPPMPSRATGRTEGCRRRPAEGAGGWRSSAASQALAFPGTVAMAGVLRRGRGGGLDPLLGGTVVIDDTTITGVTLRPTTTTCLGPSRRDRTLHRFEVRLAEGPP